MFEILADYWILVAVLGIWDFIWKLAGMYRAARLGQKIWFVILALLNTLGILPIIYLKITQHKKA
ncbi:MAG: DUF5652 family protein [Bacteroidales bacterium]